MYAGRPMKRATLIGSLFTKPLYPKGLCAQANATGAGVPLNCMLIISLYFALNPYSIGKTGGGIGNRLFHIRYRPCNGGRRLARCQSRPYLPYSAKRKGVRLYPLLPGDFPSIERRF